MRKNRIYSVVLAMLLGGAGAFTLSPNSNHHALNSTRSLQSIQLASLKRFTAAARAGGSLLPNPKRIAAARDVLGELRPYSKTRPGPGTDEVRDPTQLGWTAKLLALEVAAPAPAAAPAPPATHPAAPPSSAAPAPPAPTAASGDTWARLRECESHDNYADDTGNGYYGAYQFSLSTWEGLGFSGLPSDAPPATQDQAAQELEARSGWGQWPSCAAQLGLD